MKRKKIGTKKKVNATKATKGAFGKPNWQRTEEDLDKRKKKIRYLSTEEYERLNKKESFLEKVGRYLHVIPGRK